MTGLKDLDRINRVAKHPHTAHFPGTGPAGARCIHCEFLTADELCVRWTQLMTAAQGKRPRNQKPIDRNTRSCRHYLARTSPWRGPKGETS